MKHIMTILGMPNVALWQAFILAAFGFLAGFLVAGWIARRTWFFEDEKRKIKGTGQERLG
jgi:hypothetical protein